MIDPLHQFVISPILKWNVFGVDLSFTNSSLAVVVAVLSVFAFFSLGLRKASLVPGRLQALIEMSYNLVAGLIKDNAGSAGLKYFPFVFSIFFFVLFGNLLGMVPYIFTYTSHIIVTFTLALIVFLFVTLLGIWIHGFHFFSLFMPKGASLLLAPILIPVEIISYLSRPVSLSVRLFANMMAGHTMMKVFAGFVSMLIGIFAAAPFEEFASTASLICSIIPVTVNVVLTCFEIVIACLQAYIFTILTCVYLNDAIHLH